MIIYLITMIIIIIDLGTQYRSGVYYTSEDQRKTVAASIIKEQTKYTSPIVTEVFLDIGRCIYISIFMSILMFIILLSLSSSSIYRPLCCSILESI